MKFHVQFEFKWWYNQVCHHHNLQYSDLETKYRSMHVMECLMFYSLCSFQLPSFLLLSRCRYFIVVVSFVLCFACS